MKTMLLSLLLLTLIAWPLQAREGDPTGADAGAEQVEPEVLPELLEFVDAEYPPEALKGGLEGAVLLELLISETGAVDSVSVVESLTPELDVAAVAAAEQFVFSPAVVEGEAVPVFLLFEYTFSITEQTRKIEEYVNFSGVVKEKGTRDLISYATVVVSFPAEPTDMTLTVPWDAYLERLGGFEGQFLEEGSLVALTDSLGRFEFKSLPAGVFNVAFPNAGYRMTTESETLGQGEHLEATYFLPRTHYDEYEIVVYGKAEQKEVTRQRLNITEVERLPGFGGDAIKAVQALPGVARPSFVSGEIIVRGSGQEDTRYYLDGIEIPMLFHYGGIKSTYNSQALSSIDLYPGGFNTRYGGCVGGVVEITGRPGRRDRWRSVVDMSLLDLSLHTEGPISDKATVTLSGRRSFIGEIAKPIMKKFDNFDMATVPYYLDGVARLDYEFDPLNRLFFTYFTATDKMKLVFADEKEGSSEVSEATNALSMNSRFQRFIVGYNRKFGDWGENHLRGAVGADEYTGHYFGEFNYKFETKSYSLRDEFIFKQNDNVHYKLGVDLAHVPIDYEVNSLGDGKSVVSKDFDNMGYYANLELRLADRLLLIPGYRYDHYKEIKAGASSLRLTARYRLNDAHTLTAAGGTYNQAPVPRGQAVDPVFGNPDLPPTQARQFSLGDEWKISDLVNLKVEGYFNRQEKIPFQTDSLNVNYLADAEARMYGIEFMLRHEQGNRFFGWLSYSLSRSERRFPRKPTTDIAGEWDPNGWVVSGFDQTHHFEAVGSWNLGSKWSTGLRARYVTGNPDTPSLSYTSNIYEYNADEGEYEEVLGDYRSERMGPFFQLDVRLDKKFVHKNWIMSAYLDIQNVSYFAYKSPEFHYYNFDGSERNTVSGIIIPTLGFRAEF
ncbi:MAG: TonB-dependent receptor [bacterium]|nr:TonB-dependent receptor [bacterium]